MDHQERGKRVGQSIVARGVGGGIVGGGIVVGAEMLAGNEISPNSVALTLIIAAIGAIVGIFSILRAIEAGKFD